MLGFTGTYKGKRISVQGTGMGIPSMSIYITELMKDYGVKTLIRVGSAGSYQEDVKISWYSCSTVYFDRLKYK